MMYELLYTTSDGQLHTDRAATLQEVNDLAWLTVAVQEGNPLQIRRDGVPLWDIDACGLQEVLATRASEARTVARSMSALQAMEV